MLGVANWLSAASHEWAEARALFFVDIGLGVAALVAVLWRRRHPLGIAVATGAATALSSLAVGPAALALASLATRREHRRTAVALAVGAVGAAVFTAIVPVREDPIGVWLALVAIVGWGSYLGSRRELLDSLTRRAERAEAEQELRAAEARANERTRIAREMHDVVAHRISNVSMRAGALAFRDDLDVEEMRAESAIIRDTANTALDELRSVLQVLRDPATNTPTGRPQPNYGDIAELVDQARDTGMKVDLVDRLDAAPPDEIGRTMYRIVQEGITNARKHAAGTRLHIAIDRSDGGILVVLSNPLSLRASAPPGSGLGLVGIEERVAVIGGRLERSETADHFCVRAWLPCPT